MADDQLSEIFCEHHEDFLVKDKSGTYMGVQVKTRLPGEGPFKTGDEAIRNALNRFVALDIAFPNRFVRFILVANCDFYDVGVAETNLTYVLKRLREKPNTAFSGTMKTLLNYLRTTNKCKKQNVIDTLGKVILDGTVPKFEDIATSVAAAIASVRPDIIEYRVVIACANALIDRVLKSSSLSCDQPIRTHFVFASSPEDAAVCAIVQEKRIIAADVSNVIAWFSQTLLLPPSGSNIVPINGPTGHHILEKKMAVGGVSAPSISVAKDQQASAEYALQEWVGRYGGEIAKRRRDQVDLAVLTRCSDAHDKTYSTGQPFGGPMLAEVRAQLQALALDKEHVFGLKSEQLLGFASLATQECRIWWSDPFPLEASDGAL